MQSQNQSSNETDTLALLLSWALRILVVGASLLIMYKMVMGEWDVEQTVILLILWLCVGIIISTDGRQGIDQN